MRDVAQAREYQSPRKLGGRVRSAAAGGGNHDAPLGAGRDVDVIGIAAGLGDQLQLRQFLDDGTRKRRALLGQQYRVGVGQPRRELRGILLGVTEHHDIVALQPRKSRELAKRILVIIENSDFHEGIPGEKSLLCTVRAAAPRLSQ